MPNNFSQIINCETGESTRVEFTDEEQTAHDAELAAFLAQEATEFIKVDELPSPQFLGKDNVVFTTNPFFDSRKLGFILFASFKIPSNVSAISSAFPSLLELNIQFTNRK